MKKASTLATERPKSGGRARRLIVIVGVPFLLLAAAGAVGVLLKQRADVEEERFLRGETLVAISGDQADGVVLYKAGRSLHDTVRIISANEREEWCRAGNYFVAATRGEKTVYFPVPLTGYRCGPDEDGAYLVTVRPLPDRSPSPPPSSSSRMIYIPAGSFLLGDRLNPREIHYVWLTGFFIAEFEVTNAEFRAFLEAADGYRDSRNWTEAGREWNARSAGRVSALPAKNGHDSLRFGRPDQPVTWLNWYEASAYCRWLTRTVGGGRWLFSLPTDAEWEKAARGPDNFDYALGMSLSDAESGLYNWKKNPWDTVTVIGVEKSRMRFVPNRYGLYHMTGNVVEWSQSVNRPYNRDNPYADDERNHDGTAGSRSARGGSWYSASNAYLCIPYRDAFQPEHSTQELGFRITAKLLP